MEETSLVRTLKKVRPTSAPSEGPLVSIVVTNRQGQQKLRRFLKRLQTRTRYRPIDLVMVDLDSTGESLTAFTRWRGSKRLVSADPSQSSSAAKNQGIRAAEGELVLLASTDIEPIHPDWLGFMVDSLEDDVTAVGGVMVSPKRSTRRPTDDRDLQYQSPGFEYSKWGVRATEPNLNPSSPLTPDRREVPVLAAACLLAKRSNLLVTPYDEEYQSDAGDWDLCLRLGELGKVLLDERATMINHRSDTRGQYTSESHLDRHAEDHRWFNGLWGPALMRKLRAEVTGPRSSWYYRGDRSPTVSLNSGSDERTRDLGTQLTLQARQAGWEVSNDEGHECDMAIALAPPRDVERFARRDLSVAVVVTEEPAWAKTGSLDAATRIVVPDEAGRARLNATWGSAIAEVEEALNAPDPALFTRLLDVAAPRQEAMRIGISTAAPNWTKAQFWGDTHLARGLMRAFRRLGHEATELIVSDWHHAIARSCDVVLHLRGSTRRPVARGQWNLLWIISHPDRLEPGECDDYDLLASASQRHAEQLTAELGRPVHFLPQATDADNFKIGPRNVDYDTSVLYVGNARWPHRRAPRWLMRNGRAFHMYGKNWENFPEANFVRDDYIANKDLAAAYRSAAVVVADHHGSMRTNGFVANRLFDVLASGGVVLSDEVIGLPELFGDLIPTYSNARELESQLRILLSDSSLRRRLAAEGRQIVVTDHTLDHRARQWLQLLDQL